MEKLELIKDYAKSLKLNYLNADLKELSYQDLLLDILKNAGFPMIKRIEDFDLNFQKSITSKQINRLVIRLVLFLWIILCIYLKFKIYQEKAKARLTIYSLRALSLSTN